MTKIGANIKKIRTTKGLSQQAFADIFELTRGNISSYEENRAEPRIETVIRMAKYFGIPMEDFLVRNLTINEILKFNGDKLIGEENELIRLQLKEVPFINDHIYLKCNRGEIRFDDFQAFPKLVLPETNNNQLMALRFNGDIPHHASISAYQVNDVLVFEEVSRKNIHLCDQKTGLFTEGREIMLGRYEMSDGQMDLVLNDFNKQRFSFGQEMNFWRLLAVYEHVG